MHRYTIDRINDLLVRVDLPRLRCKTSQRYLHDTLNAIDSAIGADTEFLHGVKCECPGHINKVCHHRRAVGARLRMIEEIMALNDLKQQFMVG